MAVRRKGGAQTGTPRQENVHADRISQGILGRENSLGWEMEGPAGLTMMPYLNPHLAFSAKSKYSCDLWAAKIQRPFEIVVRPGYEVPKGLDKRNPDSIWVEGEVTEPIVSGMVSR